MTQTPDILVIGAGMAGASAAYTLSADRKVLVVEAESRPGYHSTGRSAALYSETYGNQAIRALTSAGRRFYETVVDRGFTEAPVLSPRGVLFVARADQRARIESLIAEGRETGAEINPLDAAGARAMVPALRPGYIDGGAHEPAARDMDVDAIHQGYLRGLRARGGSVLTDAAPTAITRVGNTWRVETPAGAIETPMIVNAAGAWADKVAIQAGVTPVGLVPKRRTAIIFAGPEGTDVSQWPLVVDCEERFYAKPEAGKLLGSPADETPMEPCDVQPDEMDIAIAVDRLTTALDIEIHRIEHKWAGLRSFVADKTPVIGFDTQVEGFFWLAGQGGYGIQTAPGISATVHGLIVHGAIPADILERGVTPESIGPGRLRH